MQSRTGARSASVRCIGGGLGGNRVMIARGVPRM